MFFKCTENKVSRTDEKHRIATKLYKQFSHAGGERLKKLLFDGGITNKRMLKMVEDAAKIVILVRGLKRHHQNQLCLCR